MIKRPRGRGLLSPTGFALVLLCFGLPFITVSCDTPAFSARVNYTGWDLASGGRPDVVEAEAGANETSRPATDKDKVTIPWQPMAALAVLLAVCGLIVSVVRSRLRSLIGLLAAVAAALVFANQETVHGAIVHELQKGAFVPTAVVDNMIEWRVGYWLALLLLIGVAGYNAVEVLQRNAAARTSSEPSGYDLNPDQKPR